MKTSTKAQAMFALIEQWEASAMTRKEFCAQHSINIHTFAYWRGKHKQTENTTGGFVAIELEEVPGCDEVTISYPNGVRVLANSSNLGVINELIRLGSCLP